ncbi:hypothetical protein, partial [Klebsiella pneumoniae]|uniref:hypothetical protein n=1 Tax=Klebsiella pneumoniae TaxID=573 RepID=UPI001788D9D4
GKAAKGDPTEPLSLDLSFSDLGDDEAIVQYIMALTRPEDGGDEAIQHASRQLPRAEPPVRVIYELDGSQPTFDVDTSQPPDLISEYDCFSEDELDDVPTQREVHDPESHADAWVILGDDS